MDRDSKKKFSFYFKLLPVSRSCAVVILRTTFIRKNVFETVIILTVKGSGII
uniref:Uncharacterized protein n=1 Tax=Anguilla anguilla TaxID=7936 RepID=A0A0E9U3D7_ANGAN